jgi:hypothetical protein
MVWVHSMGIFVAVYKQHNISNPWIRTLTPITGNINSHRHSLHWGLTQLFSVKIVCSKYSSNLLTFGFIVCMELYGSE